MVSLQRLRGTMWEPGTVDKPRFPNGLKVHQRPCPCQWREVYPLVRGGTGRKHRRLAKNHPEWLHDGLLNLGNPAAWNWIWQRVDKSMTDNGVDLYRQDFNIDPLGVWRAMTAGPAGNDGEPARARLLWPTGTNFNGGTPGFSIDTALPEGGGLTWSRLRRAGGPHTRSDYIAFDGSIGTAVGNQGQTYGLSQWLPYYGQGVYYKGQPTQDRIYNVRSYMGAAFGICVDVRRPDVDWDLYRRLVSQWRQVADCFLGDYYSLTPYSRDEDRWIAWQFDRPAEGDGMIQAFRREKCEESSMTFRLNGLDSAAEYEVTDLDAGTPVRISGKDLMGKGLTIEIKDKPGAAVLAYKRIR